MLKKFFTLGLFLILVSGSAWAMSTQDEITIGREAAARFEQEYGLVNDPNMQARLDRIGARLIGQAERRDLPWQFRIVNVNEFNAAAFPGGFVYATRGLMQGLDDDQLAFVLAHEIGHVDKRHSVRQIEGAQWTRIGLIAIVMGTSGGNLSQGSANTVALVDKVINSQHSQQHEAEADQYGAVLMAKAGFDPVYAVAALRTLAQQGGGGTPGFLNTLLGSHPLPADRIEHASEWVMAVPYNPPVAQPVTDR
ncbi:MAG: M48 family metalloprotease [Vulcanimicrobiota bacterium]